MILTKDNNLSSIKPNTAKLTPIKMYATVDEIYELTKQDDVDSVILDSNVNAALRTSQTLTFNTTSDKTFDSNSNEEAFTTLYNYLVQETVKETSEHKDKELLTTDDITRET